MSEATQEPAGPTPYELLGGERAVFALVDRFYDRMDADPAYADVRRLHPAALDGSRDKLKWFLSGWLGGPPLYFEKVGHPMLRARHLPFPIGTRERDQWVACMDAAMRDCGVPDDLAAGLHQAFAGTADWMRNKEG
ncbi:MAG: group II truncated hemoglobin [Burkholderiales bacterium]|nr:group II truncated hemoglobin [Burkholderiales bacterium]